MAKAKNNLKLASVLAFEKKLVPSDGYLYGMVWGDKEGKEQQIHLHEKSVRGTVSNRTKESKLESDIKNANLQTVDNAALTELHDTLRVKFTLKVLPGVQTPSVCNSPEQAVFIKQMAEKYIAENGFKELAHRYATNIANARFLWRNRFGAKKLLVSVKVNSKDADNEKVFNFNGFDFHMKDFDVHTPELDELSTIIADALCGKRDYVLLEVTADAYIGKGQDVYPSEELVFNKGKNDKSKILYQINGCAGLHSQKIGNALRTIDTWYEAYNSELGPIAIEPYGAVTTKAVAYRPSKTDFYTYFDSWSMGNPLEDATAEDYLMAVLVRGGVFGSGKEKD